MAIVFIPYKSNFLMCCIVNEIKWLICIREIIEMNRKNFARIYRFQYWFLLFFIYFSFGV